MSVSRPARILICIAALIASALPLRADIRSWQDSTGAVHLSNTRLPDLPAFRNTAPAPQPSSRGYYHVTRLSSPGSVTGRYDDLIRDAAQRYGVDFRLIKAVIHAESAFNHRAVSRKGALGLMQLMPATARDLRVSDPFDPRENVYGGTRYLKQMLQRYSNDIALSLAAYNAGPQNVERYGGVPPYRETVSYIRKVKALMRRYEQNYGRERTVYRVVKNGKQMYSSNPLP